MGMGKPLGGIVLTIDVRNASKIVRRKNNAPIGEGGDSLSRPERGITDDSRNFTFL